VPAHDFHERFLDAGRWLAAVVKRILTLVQHVAASSPRRCNMNWETPAYCEIRLGFEVTAYVYVR